MQRIIVCSLFFFQAEDGIRDWSVTGVQTCALPIFTFFLMLVVLSVSTGAKEKGVTAGIAIGAVITLEAMFAGPICGASMNPARSLAPAVVSGELSTLWVYLTAPVLGAAVAVPLWQGVRPGKPRHRGRRGEKLLVRPGVGEMFFVCAGFCRRGRRRRSFCFRRF